MISVTWKGVDKLRRDLETFAKRAVPYAAREYVNNAAFTARTEYVRRAEANMVLRSQWTVRSMQVEKTKSLKLDGMEAKTGSVADFMRAQEDGETVRAKGKHGTPIPAAAPGNRKGRKSKTPAKNRLARLRVEHARVSGARQRRNAVAIQQALKGGGGVVFLDLRKSRGLYRVSGTRRGARIRKVWDLSKRSVRVPSNPMLEQAINIVSPKLPSIATKALLYQLKRHKVLGY